MTENKSIPPLISQMILTKLGLYCSERMSIDLYYLVEAINLILPNSDINVLREKYNSSYATEKKINPFDDVLKKLKRINILIVNSKTFYDALSDKSLTRRIGIIKSPSQNEEDINRIFKKYWHKTSSEICLVNTELYNLFVFLVCNSSIQSQSIKAEYFKNLEQKDNRKINMDTNRRSSEKGN
jgi:hypothetical protein